VIQVYIWDVKLKLKINARKNGENTDSFIEKNFRKIPSDLQIKKSPERIFGAFDFAT
jgi:hypothetical protein